MYLAKTRKHRQTAYFLRESTPEGNGSGFQEICSLGPEPGAWVDYPGGNAWHVCPELINRIAKKARKFDPDLLEDLFWPFVRSDIRQATTHFRERGKTFTYRRMTREEKQTVARSTHAFDKRRAHFLKFGNMDQGPMVNMPSPCSVNSRTSAGMRSSRDSCSRKAVSVTGNSSPMSTPFLTCSGFSKGSWQKNAPCP